MYQFKMYCLSLAMTVTVKGGRYSVTCELADGVRLVRSVEGATESAARAFVIETCGSRVAAHSGDMAAVVAECAAAAGLFDEMKHYAAKGAKARKSA
jgi:hypothetical protein